MKYVAANPEFKRRKAELSRVQVLRQGGIRNGVRFKKGENMGPAHRLWKGGSVDARDGYRKIHVNGTQVFEHRHFMEQHLGRKLTRNEVCHHKNGDRLDNRIENLEVMTRAEHLLHHGIPSIGGNASQVAYRRRVA